MALAVAAAASLTLALAGCSKGSPTRPPDTVTPAQIGIAANPTDATYPVSVGSAVPIARALDQLEALGLTPYDTDLSIDDSAGSWPARRARRWRSRAGMGRVEESLMSRRGR